MAAPANECWDNRQSLGLTETRRLGQVALQFYKFLAMDPTSDAFTTAYQKVVQTIQQMDTALPKTMRVLEMNYVETEKYNSLYTDIEQRIVRGGEDIAAARVALVEAQQLRKNKQEYDALARIIQLEPSRPDSLQKIETVQSEIARIQKENIALETKLAERRKQFHLLTYAIRELERSFQDEEQLAAEIASMDTATTINTTAEMS